MQIIVTPMQHARTTMAVSLAHAMLVTAAMESIVRTLTNVSLELITVILMHHAQTTTVASLALATMVTRAMV